MSTAPPPLAADLTAGLRRLKLAAMRRLAPEAAPLTGAARSLTRKAMMSAATSGRTACASTSAGKTVRFSGGVKKLRGDCVHPDTVRAQLKVEDPDEVAEGRLAAAVRRHARGRVDEGLGHSLIGRVAHLATDALGQLVQCFRGAIDRHHREPGPARSVAVALPSSPAPTTTATLSPAPPNEAMTISQPSTYNRKAGYLPQRPQDHRRTGKRPSPDSGDSRTRRAALSFSQPDVVGTELGHR